MNYKQYLGSERWKKTRKKIVTRDGFSCQRCGSKRKLNVHHKTYKRRGFEDEQDLITLCEKCHYSIHKKTVNDWKKWFK